MQQISWLLSFEPNPETKTETSDPPSYKAKYVEHRFKALFKLNNKTTSQGEG
jgi:hypothetical protein